MRKSVVAWSFACAVLAGGTAAQAEMAAPAPAPVPDQMPFDIPYGESINLAKAEKAIAAAIAEASKSPRNWKMAVSIVDTNGDLVAFHKMDQTQVASVAISQGKARTAARFRRPSEAFANVMSTPAGGYVATLGDPPPTASPGGFPLIENGKLIGAIGCSGGTGAQDAVACKAGADLYK
jgi:glc operon protein GlcG